MIVESSLNINAAARRQLTDQWNNELSVDEKLVLRATRSKLGIKCSKCSLLGYYEEFCPRCAQVGDYKPDESTAPLKASLWNQGSNANNNNESNSNADFKLPDSNYERSYPESTLHQVLMVVMQVVAKYASETSLYCKTNFNDTLLLSTASKNSDIFYNPKLIEFPEYEKYYLNYETNRQQVQDYKDESKEPASILKLFLNDRDNVDSFQTTLSRVFDSMELQRESTLAESTTVVKLNGPPLAFTSWVESQHAMVSNRNDRCEHLCHVLTTELEQEHQREERLIASELSDQEGKSRDEFKMESMRVFQERLDAADRLMATLTSYGLISGIDQASYLQRSLDYWRTTHPKTSSKSSRSRGRSRARESDSIAEPDSVSLYTAQPSSQSSLSFIGSEFDVRSVDIYEKAAAQKVSTSKLYADAISHIYESFAHYSLCLSYHRG